MQSSLSTIIRRPWKGRVDSALTVRRDETEADAVDWVGFAFRKFAELCLLTALIAVPLLYNLQLPESWLIWLSEVLGPQRAVFFQNELLPYLYVMMPTLETKSAGWVLIGLAMFAGFFAARLLESLFRRSFYHHRPEDENSLRRAHHRVVPLAFFSIFFVYALASIFFWPPPLAPEALGAEQGRELDAAADAMVGWPAFLHPIADFIGRAQQVGGGFFSSVIMLTQLFFAFLFFLVVEDMIRERRFVNKILATILMVGIINALVVVLLKLQAPWIKMIWIDFDPSEYRNNLGAFIGHNTGLSSFLIAPFLISIVWLIGTQPRRRGWFRVLLGGCTLLMALALALAQSRAVIPILGLIIPAMIFVMARRSCLVYSSRFFIWLPVGLAFVFATQFIPSRFNPLYREDVTMVRRVMEFRPERLLTETRLRVFAVASSELIPASPLLGHGFGSFHYVFPPAQGDYFQRHPRSRLAPLELRTAQAHNEYLQTVIELGFIGLALALAGLAWILRGGLRVMTRSLMPYHVATQVGVLFSLIGILMHAFVDFPFRVPPIALTFLVLLAIWSAGDRLWIFPLREPRGEDDVASPSPTPKKRRATKASGLSLATSLGAVAGALILLCGVAWVASRTVVPFLSVNTLVMRGEQRLSLYMAGQGNFNTLLLAEGDFILARRIYWIYGPTNQRMSIANQQRAAHFYRIADQMVEDGQPEAANSMRTFATSVARIALTDMRMTFVEENHHRLHQINSFTYDLMARNHVGREREDFFELSRQSLTRSVMMNPGDWRALSQLLDLLQSLPSPPGPELRYFFGLFHHFHLFHFDRLIRSPLEEKIASFYLPPADRQLEFLVGGIPDDLDLAKKQVYVAIRAGQFNQARTRYNALRQRFSSRMTEAEQLDVIILQMMISGGLGELDSVREGLRLLQARNYRTIPLYPAAIGYLLESRVGDQSRAQYTALRQEAAQAMQSDPLAIIFVMDAAFNFFRDYEQTVELYERYRAIPNRGDIVGLPQRTQALISYAALGRWEQFDAEFALLEDSFMTLTMQQILPEMRQYLQTLRRWP